MKNAFYARGERVIVLCYELVQARLQLITRKLKTASNDIVVAAAVGSVAFVMMHELGHALLHLSAASFLGREEDVADQFATYMILESEHVPRRHDGLRRAHCIRGYRSALYAAALCRHARAEPAAAIQPCLLDLRLVARTHGRRRELRAAPQGAGVPLHGGVRADQARSRNGVCVRAQIVTERSARRPLQSS